MMSAMKTIAFGKSKVPVVERLWKTGGKVPYKKTYRLKPGDSWFDAEETQDQNEHYVLDETGTQIPVGVQIARDLIHEGASMAVLVEMWAGTVVLLDHSLNCVAHDCEIGSVLKQVREANGGMLGGFPDVAGIFPDGRITLCEAKNMDAKDRLGSKQHEMADLLRELYGERLDLRIVEWRFA